MQVMNYNAHKSEIRAYPDTTTICGIICGGGCLAGCLALTIVGSAIIATGGITVAFACADEEGIDPL